METITDDTVIEKLRELLQNADMETTTGNRCTPTTTHSSCPAADCFTCTFCIAERQLRKTLEQQLGVDLSGHKALIRTEVAFESPSDSQHDCVRL